MNKRKEAVRGIKFALFSVSAGIIELASFALLEVFTPWPYWPNYLIALVLSVLCVQSHDGVRACVKARFHTQSHEGSMRAVGYR